MKKLTAGIFTALLGLVTVNAANAAIPSTTYVDTKITTAQEAAQDYADAQDATLKSTIETDYKAADATLKSGYETADAALKSAYEAADTALDGKITANANEIAGLKTSKQDALTAGSGIEILTAENGKLTIQTKGIATSESLTDLQTRMTTAEDEIDDLQGDVQTLTTADATNLQAAKDYADGLASNYDAAGLAAAAETSAKAYADGLAKNYDAAGAAATAQANAETYTDGKIDALAATYETKTNVSTAVQEAKDFASNAASQAGTDAKSYADGLASNYDAAGAAADALTEAQSYADQAEADAVATAKSYANTELAKKVDKTGHTASQVVITDSTGAIATAAQIPNTQVSGLGDLATKSTIADADVAANAAIAQSKIDGLTDALAGKMPVRAIATDTISEAGTYVLTATQENGVINYTWELIERPTTGGEG